MDLFENRQHAGQELAKKLIQFKNENPVILAIPRGGVPIGFEIAKALSCPLDILMVKKIGAPQQPELAIGAISEDGKPYFNRALLKTLNVERTYMKKVASQKLVDLRQQIKLFRRGKAPQNIRGRTVILVDDGIATGATLIAAIHILKGRNVKKVIVAAPVGAQDSIDKLRTEDISVITVLNPANFQAVGLWYRDFPQVSDSEVISLMDEARYLNTHRNPEKELTIQDGHTFVHGILTIIPNSEGLVIFAHGSGSSRYSPRNQRVAQELNQSGLSTLLFDLLDEKESNDRSNVFNINLLAHRLLLATEEALKSFPAFKPRIGYFGASTGAGAALMAAAQSEHTISAVVSRGGRPDLAGTYLEKVSSPTLLLVGGNDPTVLELNKKASQSLASCELTVIPGAGHLFEETGTMEEVIEYASQWFHSYLLKPQRESSLKEEVVVELEKRSHPIRDAHSWNALIKNLSSRRVVMLGEATHGTQGFYNIRRYISERLIQDHGFNFIAVEGDWPDCQKLNDYIHTGHGESAKKIMRQFQRWPTWMWANEETAGLIEWMRNYGASFYGLDVYSLFESLDYVKEFARKLDPEMAQSVLEGYACFDPFDRNEKAYARYLTKFDEGCRQEVTKNLRALLRLRLNEIKVSSPELLNAQQSARIVAHAEQYYRSMLFGGAESWNTRDLHMIDTLESLLHYTGANSKCIVWAHNTHIGDYHATDMLEEGYVNLGGLARERFGSEAVALVGFGTYEGQVLASPAWEGAETKMTLPASRKASFEDFCHKTAQNLNTKRLYFLFDADARSGILGTRQYGHRAVGVVYQPQMEARGTNYVKTIPAKRYDAFVFVDKTSALISIPTKISPLEFPETWPGGL